MKNPIASIIAQVENFTPADDKDGATLDKIKEQAVRMNKLISEISEAAIVDNDLVTQARERFDLSNTVSEIVEHYIDTNEYSKLNLSSEIQKNVVLLGLPERIGQVLVNLLDNAISFSKPSGNINVQLIKKWRRKPLLIVEDSGPGVSEASAEKIFDRFSSNYNFFYESVGNYNADLSLSYNISKHSFYFDFGRKYFDGWSKNEEFTLFPKSEPADTNRTKSWNPKEQYFGKIQ